jgi:hypothetical protein
MKWYAGVVVLALVALAACGADEGDELVLMDMHTVEVWFTRNEEPTPARRRVAGAPLDGALRALVLGPTAEERADGLTSWFSPETRNVIRRVQAADGDVIVDFRDLPDLIPGASTSAGSQHLLASLDYTVFQFDWVETVEYRLDGSCDAFWEWLQRSCEVVTRE